MVPLSLDGFIHLGESCFERRHYDCIGLVKWKQTMEQQGRLQDSAHRRRHIVAIAQPGDIVAKDISDSHIGICTPANGHVAVTNCRSMKDGLMVSALGPEWHFLARLESL